MNLYLLALFITGLLLGLLSVLFGKPKSRDSFERHRERSIREFETRRQNRNLTPRRRGWL